MLLTFFINAGPITTTFILNFSIKKKHNLKVMIWQLTDSKQRRGGWLLKKKKKKEAADGIWNHGYVWIEFIFVKIENCN